MWLYRRNAIVTSDAGVPLPMRIAVLAGAEFLGRNHGTGTETFLFSSRFSGLDGT